MQSNDIVVRLREVPNGIGGYFYRTTQQAADEIERLRAGGCARDQKTTQYCAEAVVLQEKCNELHERCMHLENYIDIECENKEIPMEGEITADIRIVCEEIRKKRRVSVVLEAWSEELDTVTLKIEDHDLESDLKSATEVNVPYQSLMDGLNALRSVIRG
jgi:hypothetical protein